MFCQSIGHGMHAATLGMNQNECCKYGNRRTSEYGNGGRVPAFSNSADCATPAANNVQPLLHVALVLELGGVTSSFGFEECIEVELSNSPPLATASSSSGI